MQEQLLSRELQLRPSLFYSYYFVSTKSIVQRFQQCGQLEGHSGCVNTIAWNEDGSYLVSGSDDCRLKIWNPLEGKEVASIESGHITNIFSAKFLTNTNSNKIVSCSADGMIRYIDLERKTKSSFLCNNGITFEMVADPIDSNVFFSCCEDGTVKQFDLRIKTCCECNFCNENTIVKLKKNRTSANIAIASLAFKPTDPTIFSIGCWDSYVRSFDRRMIKDNEPFYQICPSYLKKKRNQSTFPLNEESKFKITCLRYSNDGNEMLVSYSNEGVYLVHPNSPDDETSYQFPEVTPMNDSGSPKIQIRGDWADTGPDADVPDHVNPVLQHITDSLQKFIDLNRSRENSASTDDSEIDTSQDKDVLMCYKGHRNVRTIFKEAGFYGANNEYVASGSDDGRVFFWDKKTGEIVHYFVADSRVVNCFQPHPTTAFLATSGIDSDVKLWAPIADEPNSLCDKDEIVKKNEKFLGQSDSLVVPPSFIFQLLNLS